MRVPDPPPAVRLLLSGALGVGAGLAVLALGGAHVAALVGWNAGGLFYLAWAWLTIGPLDPRDTMARARPDDPDRLTSDGIVIIAAVASLAAVALLLTREAHEGGTTKDVYAALALLSVAVAWAVVHTVFTLRYASLYYKGPHEEGGIGFNQDAPPRYMDFAYLAFGIGATFQVSDTNISTSEIRATVLRHSLLSYVFATVILAAMINLVASLVAT
jgi:uncharacterized membrane protein